jgi:multicomponent K+:H+ antiporter subunit G
VGCVLIASAIFFTVQRGSVSLHELLITLFLFLTAPVSAHLLVKALLKEQPQLRPPLPRRDYEKR